MAFTQNRKGACTEPQGHLHRTARALTQNRKGTYTEPQRHLHRTAKAFTMKEQTTCKKEFTRKMYSIITTEKNSKKIAWNSQDQGRYNALYNKLKSAGENVEKQDYINKFNKSKLQQFISDLSISRKESYYFLVAKWF